MPGLTRHPCWQASLLFGALEPPYSADMGAHLRSGNQPLTIGSQFVGSGQQAFAFGLRRCEFAGQDQVVLLCGAVALGLRFAVAAAFGTRRLQPFRYLHSCSGCFRLELWPVGLSHR